MRSELLEAYNGIRGGEAAYFVQKRGLFAVHGGESVQFLDGLITNDLKTLNDGEQIAAGFPNAQGRLLAVANIVRDGDRFLIETEEATRESLFNNLHRFTFAGDFFVKDLSHEKTCFEIYGRKLEGDLAAAIGRIEGAVGYALEHGARCFIPDQMAGEFRDSFPAEKEWREIPAELYETLRIESGIPFFGVDMDERTIVPELGIDGMISYTKGCYIGQEIIARIHYRGHVAKKLTGLIFPKSDENDAEIGALTGQELTASDGKPGGHITSAAYSPKLGRIVAMAFVRYDYLAEGTELMAGNIPVNVNSLPFVKTAY